ncbi:peptide chain release factor 2 [Patescibacteria group bacterium]|nr:peptide chain release factor 2 [Patescibacteria group bacterium]
MIQLEILVGEKDFWDNPKKAAEISEELSDLNEQVNFWEGIEKEVSDLKGLVDVDGIEKEIVALEKRFSEEEFKVFFSGEYDRKNAVISIFSGAGGTEAQDWAEMLMKMYIAYIEKKGFKYKILDISKGQEAGIKSVVLEVIGSYSYAYLKGENGVHRLVRLSPFNSDNLRHTSFALVEVLPELEVEDDIEIKDDDLKIDTFRASGPGGQNVNMRSTAVRITHLPSKIVASCQSERSQAQNKERAFKLLYTKLYQKKLLQDKKEKKQIRGDLPSVEWGSQIRSYVLHPYKMVKDHRTEVESSDPESILNGELDKFIEAEIKL